MMGKWKMSMTWSSSLSLLSIRKRRANQFSKTQHQPQTKVVGDDVDMQGRLLKSGGQEDYLK